MTGWMGPRFWAKASIHQREHLRWNMAVIPITPHRQHRSDFVRSILRSLSDLASPQNSTTENLWREFKFCAVQHQPKTSHSTPGSKTQLQWAQTWSRTTGNIWPLSLQTEVTLQSIRLNFCYVSNVYYTHIFTDCLKIIQCDFLYFFQLLPLTVGLHLCATITDLCHLFK